MKRYRHYQKDKAIILSCFGSVVEAKKYEKLKEFIEDRFKIDTFISFSSRSVIKILKKKGILYKNLPQVLADTDLEGYKKIIVSSVNLFPTDEHEMVKKTARGFREFSLSNIRVTKAIFTKSKDTTNFLSNLSKQISKDNTANLFIIHGTPLLDIPGSESISYVERLLPKLNPLNFVCSLEGSSPFYALKEHFIREFKKADIKKVQIIPLLLVSGNHFIKDMKEIMDELNRDFETFIAPSITESENFNLIEMEDIKEIISKNIEEEIIKLGE